MVNGSRCAVIASIAMFGLVCLVVAAPNDGTKWQSKHFDVSVSLEGGWSTTNVKSAGDTYDRPDGLVMAFLNKAGPYVYIIKHEKDVPLDRVSRETYLAAIRKQFTSHPAYKLVDEGDVDFHGSQFHRFRLKITGTKGDAAMYLHIFRDGQRLTTVQWTFPLTNAGEIRPPDAVTQFDKGVNFKPQTRAVK